MIAPWYTDGELELAPFQDGRRHIRRSKPVSCEPLWSFDDETPCPFSSQTIWTEVAHRLVRAEVPGRDMWRRLSRRERRRIARLRGRGRGRRWTVRVPRLLLVQVPPLPAVEMWLYLPQGERVEQRHLADVERWAMRRG